MDKTVRLWHVSRSECLCAFQHLDFVTSIAFHPKDDRSVWNGFCSLRRGGTPLIRDLLAPVSSFRDLLTANYDYGM